MRLYEKCVGEIISILLDDFVANGYFISVCTFSTSQERKRERAREVER